MGGAPPGRRDRAPRDGGGEAAGLRVRGPRLPPPDPGDRGRRRVGERGPARGRGHGLEPHPGRGRHAPRGGVARGPGRAGGRGRRNRRLVGSARTRPPPASRRARARRPAERLAARPRRPGRSNRRRYGGVPSDGWLRRRRAPRSSAGVGTVRVPRRGPPRGPRDREPRSRVRRLGGRRRGDARGKGLGGSAGGRGGGAGVRWASRRRATSRPGRDSRERHVAGRRLGHLRLPRVGRPARR